MKDSKVIKKLNSLIEQSKKNLGDSFCLKITDESVEIYGITDKQIILYNAALFMRINNQTFIKGFFDKEKYEFSSIKNLPASSDIVIGVDYSVINDNIIYLKLINEGFYSFSASDLSEDDAFYLYWEYNNSSCITIFEYNPIEDDTVVLETISLNKVSLRKILRTFVQNLLSGHKSNNINSSFFTKNLIIEEIKDTIVKSDDEEVYSSESQWK
ncbi:hypothetical protein ACIP9G_13300 [Lysinibacillus sp. NPDC093197]|uniref:hypothetical protein n=1 Tax=Lysinibacillus sp. NPDC093197 TaxID=3364132 RepID=UPI00382332B0